LGFEDLACGSTEFERPFGGEWVLSCDGTHAIGSEVFAVWHRKTSVQSEKSKVKSPE
jgi:hypothetical protein